MADQVPSGTVDETAGNTGARGLDSQIGPTYPLPAYHGNRSSWVAVSIIIAGFIVGGIALTTGPTWWLFWTGAGIAAIGGIYGLSTHILDDWY